MAPTDMRGNAPMLHCWAGAGPSLDATWGLQGCPHPSGSTTRYQLPGLAQDRAQGMCVALRAAPEPPGAALAFREAPDEISTHPGEPWMGGALAFCPDCGELSDRVSVTQPSVDPSEQQVRLHGCGTGPSPLLPQSSGATRARP